MRLCVCVFVNKFRDQGEQDTICKLKIRVYKRRERASPFTPRKIEQQTNAKIFPNK